MARPPDSLCFDDDGELMCEWYHGAQGHPDSWRILYCAGGDEGHYTIETRTGVSHLFLGDEAIPALQRLLAEMCAP